MPDSPLPAPVRVVDYDPAWSLGFQSLSRRVKAAFQGVDVDVEHVGSTAVPGLAAKPIIDIDVVVSSPEDVPNAIERLASLGYVHQGDLGIVGRESFAPPDDLPHLHHLYVVVAGSKPHEDHLLFRDYLRHHPEEVGRYARRKREVEHLLARDRNAYVEAKREVIAEILQAVRAEAEAVSGGVVSRWRPFQGSEAENRPL